MSHILHDGSAHNASPQIHSICAHIHHHHRRHIHCRHPRRDEHRQMLRTETAQRRRCDVARLSTAHCQRRRGDLPRTNGGRIPLRIIRDMPPDALQPMNQHAFKRTGARRNERQNRATSRQSYTHRARVCACVCVCACACTSCSDLSPYESVRLCRRRSTSLLNSRSPIVHEARLRRPPAPVQNNRSFSVSSSLS
jgi:hypothetical protein